MNRKRVKELIKSHVEEIASSLEVNAYKDVMEMDTKWFVELYNRLGKVILAITRYQEGEIEEVEEKIEEAKEIVESIEW